jgi:PAS fold
MANNLCRHCVPLDRWGSLERVQGDRRNDFVPTIHMEDVERVLAKFDACIRDGGSYELIYRVVQNDEVRTLKCNSVTHKNADGSER